MANPRFVTLNDTARRFVIIGDPLFAKVPTFTYNPGGGTTPSVFANGAWDDSAAWSDTDTWRDVA